MLEIHFHKYKIHEDDNSSIQNSPEVFYEGYHYQETEDKYTPAIEAESDTCESTFAGLETESLHTYN